MTFVDFVACAHVTGSEQTPLFLLRQSTATRAQATKSTELKDRGAAKGGGASALLRTDRRGGGWERATTIVVGTERVKTRGKWRTVEVLACPVTWRPHPEQIASARRGYEDWWYPLDWVRDGLLEGGMLRDVEVTATMPKVQPWLRR